MPHLPWPGLWQPEQTCLLMNAVGQAVGRVAAEEDSRAGRRGTKGIGDDRILLAFLQRNLLWGQEHTPGLTHQGLPGCQIQGRFSVLASWTLFCIWPFEARLLVLCFSSDISSNVLLVPLQKPLPLLSPIGFSFPGVSPTLFFVSIHTPFLNKILYSYNFHTNRMLMMPKSLSPALLSFPSS